MSIKYWLLKSEPTTYSFQTLLKDKTTKWSGVRNYQARIYLNEMRVGDLALIYHSGKDKSIQGLSKIVKASYFESRERNQDWVQVDIEYYKSFTNPVTLKNIKLTSELKNLVLIKQSRLSVSPVQDTEFQKIIYLGGLSL